MSKESKMYKKMHNLMGSISPMPRENAFNYHKDSYFSKRSQGLAYHVYLICNVLGIIDDEIILRVWKGIWNDRRVQNGIAMGRTLGDNYKKNIVVGQKRKDNPNLYEGEVFRGYGTPRMPRKRRKTAWKRFYKCFPRLDPKNKKDDTKS